MQIIQSKTVTHTEIGNNQVTTVIKKLLQTQTYLTYRLLLNSFVAKFFFRCLQFRQRPLPCAIQQLKRIGTGIVPFHFHCKMDVHVK